ncbi:MAG TPA: DUF4386 domain-containing protein [Chloroflexia bacterium]
MNSLQLQITGLVLILVPVVFNVFYALLQRSFDYPNILREPTEHVLLRFQEGGPRLRLMWYGFMLSAVLFVPVVLLLHEVLSVSDTLPYLGVATTLGVLSAAVQFLGLVRWPFLVPYLAQTYTDPRSSQATRDAVAVTFQAFHRYAGVGIGENLGYLFTGSWTLLVGIAMIGSPLFAPWIGWIAIIPAIGIFVGIFEEAGVKAAGVVTAISYIVWSLWLVAAGINLLWR